jgi:NhaP-type Na+/H+ or K+/H+ antiporter
MVYAYPMIQIGIVAAATFGMAAYLLAVRPYREEAQQTSVVVDEIVLLIVEMFFLYLYLKEDTITDE